jgi:hypothetical protein
VSRNFINISVSSYLKARLVTSLRLVRVSCGAWCYGDTVVIGKMKRFEEAIVSRVNDMTRLHDQIQSGRLGRRTLVADLARGDADMKKAISDVRGANLAANEERSRSVMATLSSFMANLAAAERGRQQVAAQSRKARANSANKLARDIGSKRHAYRIENAAARSAWHGTASRNSAA